MGHQMVIPALSQISTEIQKKFIGELVFNAPDFPVDEFLEKAPGVKNLVERMTLYCSYNDNAIAASETYNGGRRMGACEKVPDVDVVNVSEIDAPTMGVGGLGHGYYASRAILADVYQVLLHIDAEKRLFIRKSEPNATEDFILRP
jgi:esterase/lipase superfamily enzyme